MQLMESSELEVLQGELQKISYQNADNGWTVARMRCDEKELPITVVGHFGPISIGEYYEMHGAWVQNQKYGRQFKAHHWSQVYPHSLAGILRYLKSGLIKGIGEKTATRIINHFGLKTLEILDQEPARLLEIPKIGKKKKQEIVQAWNERKRFRDTEIFLSGLGVSPPFISKIIKIYGERASALIQEDPFRLARDIAGIGFLTADRIAQELGIAADSPLRLRAALSFQLELAEEQGHCYQTRDQLRDALVQLLRVPLEGLEPLLEEALIDLTDRAQIVFDEARGEAGQVLEIYYAARTFAAEDAVADRVGALLRAPFQAEPEERIIRYLQHYAAISGQPFSKAQLDAVQKAVSHRIFVLTGGPGVGKTTTANAIIRLLLKMQKSVALAAPTGRAAQRLSEVAAIGAKTIHRLLEWSATEHSFMRDEQTPLDAQVIIIDEASMLDVHLAAALFRALPSEAQLILIGDVDQLPSVGPGNVLRDLIESGVVPYTKLNQIFRQSSGSSIVQIAHEINRGEVPSFAEAGLTDCQFITIEDPGSIKEVIKELVHKTLPERGSYDALRDIQVLTPMNKGPLGTHTLNQELQALLNPDVKAEAGERLASDTITLRAGDKVIQTVNNYELNVFNGDIGFVELAGFDGGQVLVNFGDRKVSYPKEEAYDLKLAYAITIHKAQGSEFPVVIIPISMQHFIMLQRNLLYTALTRAKRLAILVGTQSAMAQAIKTQTSLKRQTHLIYRLKPSGRSDQAAYSRSH